MYLRVTGRATCDLKILRANVEHETFGSWSLLIFYFSEAHFFSSSIQNCGCLHTEWSVNSSLRTITFKVMVIAYRRPIKSHAPYSKGWTRSRAHIHTARKYYYYFCIIHRRYLDDGWWSEWHAWGTYIASTTRAVGFVYRIVLKVDMKCVIVGLPFCFEIRFNLN